MGLREELSKRGLSNRECEVAEQIAQGFSNRAAADRLFITEKTVKFHLTNIYKKMNVKSRAQLIVWCARHLDFIESDNEPVHIVGKTQEQSPAPTPESDWVIPSGINKVGTA